MPLGAHRAWSFSLSFERQADFWTPQWTLVGIKCTTVSWDAYIVEKEIQRSLSLEGMILLVNGRLLIPSKLHILGSVDCTLHRDLCSRFNIRQYPTTVLYNQSVPHEYMGFHTASEIVDFVKDTLNPAGKKLSFGWLVTWRLRHYSSSKYDVFHIEENLANWPNPRLCLNFCFRLQYHIYYQIKFEGWM